VPHLHLLTLGAPLLLTAAGEHVKFRTRKHFALLIRLAVEAGRRLTRDYLMDLLWGNAPTHLARHSLAQALTVLKQKVGSEHLLIQRAAVALVEGAVDADVSHLDACDLQIRGPFLDGFEVPAAGAFEQWKDEWRAKLTPRIRDCLVKQMDAGRRIGDFATVERHAQVLHDLDPVSEDAVRGLMEARAWVGDRTNALKAYARFEERLREELGAKPGAELVRVADLLRQGRRPGRPPQHGSGAAQPLVVSERHERRFEAETLIGREQPFAKLYDAWLEVRHRTPRIMVVTGDPGVGKTTLTNAFVSTCQMEGAVVARAQAYDAERELPFAILAELIKQLTLQRTIGGADPEALSELSRVSPEIFNVFPGVPKPAEWAAEVIPLRLADAFLKAVEAATDEGPLVLVVDDIHAADNASAAILHMVARKLPRTRLLLILTGRTNELRTAAAPSALVSDTTVQALQGLELEPLSAEAAERLVTALAVRADAKIRVGELPTTRILQAGNGNPLALELLTKEWVAHGSSSLLSDIEALNTQPVANIGIPRAIGAVFDRQIRRLDATWRAALDLAAVLGRRLADLALYDVVGLAPASAGEALTRLLDEGFLREVHGGLEFRNELIRAQAYYAIAGPARQHLHREVGKILAERPPEKAQSLNLEISWHFLRGEDAPAALPSALRGADQAIRLGAPSEAEHILRALLREPTLGAVVQSIRLHLANALLDQSKGDAAIPVLDTLLEDPTLLPRDYAQVARLRAAAEYLHTTGTGPGYGAAAIRAVEASRQVGDLEIQGKALFEYARSGVVAGDQIRLASAQKETERLLEHPGAQDIPILHYTSAYCHYVAHELRRSANSLERAIELLHASSARVAELSFAYTGYGSCMQGLCEFDVSDRAFRTALDLAKKSGDDSRASIIASNLCGTEMFRGNYEAAIEIGKRSVDLAARVPHQPGILLSFSNLAGVYALTGQKDEALRWLDQAHSLNAGQRSWEETLELLIASASITLTMGNLSLALELIEEAETAATGRESVVSNAGPFDKLRVFRVAHTKGPDPAAVLAREVCRKYKDRHPMYYLDALAVTAWLERRTAGHHASVTLGDLEALGKRAPGKYALLMAQGFLS